MRGTFSVIPMTCTLSCVVRPHLALRAVANWPPTSAHASQRPWIARRSSIKMSLRLFISMNSWNDVITLGIFWTLKLLVPSCSTRFAM
jgi:hypothetical protein